MGWGFLTRGQSLLGVDIGASSVKAVLLNHTRRGLVLRYAGLTELPRLEGESKDPSAVMALYEIFQEGGLKRRKMAINYDGGGLTVRYLQLPKMPKDEIREAVRWEAKKVIQQTLDEVVLDYLIVGETEERDLKRYEILLIVADRASILNQLEALKPFRSQIVAMDVNPTALINTVKANYARDLGDNLAFVDIGSHKMDINICKNGVLRFYRNVQMGGEAITRVLMQSKQVDFEEAEQIKRQVDLLTPSEGEGENVRTEVDRMILETQRSMDYYRAQFREGGVRKIILMGGTALMPGFREYFASYFDSEVVLDNPFSTIRSGQAGFEELESLAPRFSTSVGLALRGVGG